MRHLPRDNYNGLTVVLSNPSRFDTHELLSGFAGHFFNTECLGPHTDRHSCDIRTTDTQPDGLLPDTKAILLLGQQALHEWSGKYPNQYKDYSVGEQRGCPLENKYNIPMIVSYLPQDCMDMKDYEATLNPLLNQHEDEDYEDDTDDSDSVKHKGKTKRGNYRFWLQRDVWKLLSTVIPGVRATAIKSPYVQPDGAQLGALQTTFCPNLSTICATLRSMSGSRLYVDIETDPNFNIRCIGIGYTDTTGFRVVVIPVVRYDYTFWYSNLALLFAALSIAFSRNEVICHNGFAFDLPFMAWRYGIQFGRNNYDTMIAHHRCFPEVEKSLGHCGSLWTWESYHKDSGCFEPKNSEQEQKLWHYNAKDVYVMYLIRESIDRYAAGQIGLQASIEQGNNVIYAYVMNTMMGIRVNGDMITKISTENDAKMTQMLRVCKLLLKRDFLPTSTKQCHQYFHEQLWYKVMGRSKESNNPSYNDLAMQKLKLAYPDNPMLDLCLMYRQIKKETGSLKFQIWNPSHFQKS